MRPGREVESTVVAVRRRRAPPGGAPQSVTSQWTGCGGGRLASRGRRGRGSAESTGRAVLGRIRSCLHLEAYRSC